MQAFQKIPALKAIAPAQTEPPYVITQLLILLLFNVLIVTAIRFRLAPPGRAALHA